MPLTPGSGSREDGSLAAVDGVPARTGRWREQIAPRPAHTRCPTVGNCPPPERTGEIRLPPASPKFLHRFAFLVAAFFLLHGAAADAAPAPGADLSVRSDGLWRDVAPRVPIAGERLIVPERYRQVALDHDVFRQLFFSAPMEGSEAAQRAPVLIGLPLPDGDVAHFQIVETAVMAPELAAKFPEIRTWLGQGLDDPAATVRLDWTPQGFHAMILSTVTGRVFIDPYSRNDTANYISYYARDHASPSRWNIFPHPPVDPGGRRAAKIKSLMAKTTAQAVSGTQLRTYRLAVAATGEYTAFHGGTVPLGQAAIVTTINRVNGIYETDLAVRMVLVANNNLLVYTNGATDPLHEQQRRRDAGRRTRRTSTTSSASANYDIGHVFSTGGGGVATLGVPCVAGIKARGVTGLPSPSATASTSTTSPTRWATSSAAITRSTASPAPAAAATGTRPRPTSRAAARRSMAYAGICGTAGPAAQQRRLTSTP